MKKTSKLKLNRETVKQLTAVELEGVAGGVLRSINATECFIYTQGWNGCYTATCTCTTGHD